MNIREIIYNSRFNNKQLLLGIALILFVIFHKPFELILTNTVVKYVLSYVESIWYNDILFFLAIFLAIISVIRKFKKYSSPSQNQFVLFLCLAIIYLFYRYYRNAWILTPVSIAVYFKYADVIILAITLHFLLLFKSNKESNKNGFNSFIDDEPIGKTKVDNLGYAPYAELVASRIGDSHFNRAFAIGINGKWGMGKTSFLNLVKGKISDTSTIKIDFNPWNSNSPKAIIQDFFGTVQERIRPFNSSLSGLLISYSNKLVSLNDNTMTQSIQTSVNAITGLDSLTSLFEDINNSLKKINKKIIVYIDDLDRLDKEEIVEVIRLIRNTANFHNTFFVVAYDRNYIVTALRSHNPYNQEQFLEKIFQLEITLPFFKKDVLRYKLASKLIEKFPKNAHDEINEKIIGSPSSIPYFLNDWLESIRDVTRLTNSLMLNFSRLNGEVDFNDFLRLELLHVKYPSVYELMYRKTDQFFKFTSDSNNRHRYILTSEAEAQKNKLLWQHLKSHGSELSVPLIEIDKILFLIESIFEERAFYGHSKNSLSVVFPSKFNRYFAYNLLEGSLSEIEYSRARALISEEFNKKITLWVEQKLELELKSRFYEIHSFDNRDDFEKVIIGIFHLANQSSFNPSMSFRKLVGYDGKDLYNKLNNYENKLALRYYSNPNEAEGLKGFILKLFTNAQSPFSFEADFIRHVDGEISDTFPISKDELHCLVLNYLQTYCSKNEKLDSSIWSLYHCSRQTLWIPTSNNSFRSQEKLGDDVKDILKAFVLDKDFDGFLFDITEYNSFDQNKFCISNVVLELFETWQIFKEILESQSEEKWKYLAEFKRFFLAYEVTNFSQYVVFIFEQIPIRDKIRR